MTPERALHFANLALSAVHREYPNKLSHVLHGDADVRPPRELTPVFYGCFDWHSAVHGHWMLVRLLRLYPDLPEREEIRAVMNEHLTDKNIKAEADYFLQPNRKSFERTYGWAWLLKLAEELHTWDDPDARRWSKSLQSLVDVLVGNDLALEDLVDDDLEVGATIALDKGACAVDNEFLQAALDECRQLEPAAHLVDNFVRLQRVDHVRVSPFKVAGPARP